MALIYIATVTVSERSVGVLLFLVFALLGVLAASVFWYFVSLFYYWSYSRPGVQLRSTPHAQPLLFPPAWFGNLEDCRHPPIADVLNRICRLPAKLSHDGYAASANDSVWELHFFAAVSLLGYFALYLALLPINAPILLPWGMKFLLVFTVLPATMLLVGIITTPSRLNSGQASLWATFTKWLFVAACLGIVAAWTFSAISGHLPREERGMPTLASIAVLLTFLTWLLGMLAFFFDRYRVPVLSLALLLVISLKLPGWSTGEHYFSAITLSNDSLPPAPNPATVFRRKITDRVGMPLIIVTATGGGIHAAAWAAEILGDLEKRFASEPELERFHYTLHDNLLLASSVSGGSVGLVSYLREYTAPNPFHSVNHFEDMRERITGAASCSSLEAVAWGLEYYDFANFLFTVLPLPSSGADMVDGKPIGRDRSWALETAFSRNQTDGHCGTTDNLEVRGIENSQSMTLYRSVQLLVEDRLPAFTLNTTVSETGDRFLLSNYEVPKQTDQSSDVLPAESFLHAYGQPGADGAAKFHHHYADLSLATAARLSATFPYVSSASRLPRKFADYAFHFVDGGYFDNDGTSSVVEFLHSALVDTSILKGLQARIRRVDPRGQRNAKIPIVLIEIRNGWDLAPADNADSFVHQDSLDWSGDHYVQKPLTPWRAIQQFAAPPKTLWFSGHDSITRRNRRELCLLELAYRDTISIHHLVFDYENLDDEYQPLNWHLTARQKRFIREEGNSRRIKAKLQDAAEWVERVLTRGLNESGDNQVCRVANP